MASGVRAELLIFRKFRSSRLTPGALVLLFAAAGCTSVAQVTSLSDPRCEETVSGALAKILESQGETAPAARRLAESATAELRTMALGPRPFLIPSPSGVDYSFFVEKKRDACLLRLYGRQKGFVSYTNNLTYIATEPLAPCRCEE